MSYNGIIGIAMSPSLSARVAACAASEGIDDPQNWAKLHRWEIASSPGWDDAWSYAEGNKSVNVNPDTGMRDDVINDSMILAAVQAVQAAQTAV